MYELLERILEMDGEDLLEYIQQESPRFGVEPEDYEHLLDPDDDIQDKLDFIAIYINPEYEHELYIRPREDSILCVMYTNARDQAELEDELDHDFFSD